MKNNKWLISFTIATFVTTGLVLAVSLFAHSFYDKAGWPADVLTVGLTLCVTAAVSFGTVVAANASECACQSSSAVPQPF